MAIPPDVCVGALIINSEGRLFLQLRSSSRRLFPNCWDIVGGHVEPGETVEQALLREVAEETGWRVERIHPGLPRIAWTGDDGRARIEYDFPVTVAGDLGAPQLEAGKHTAHHWAGAHELGLLKENRVVDPALEEWIGLLAGALGAAERPDPGLVEDAAAIGAAIEGAFVTAMRRLPRIADAAGVDGASLVRGFGGPAAVGALIEFRTALGWPQRWITQPEALALARYGRAESLIEGLAGSEEAGMLEIARSGAFRATERGHEFLRALRAHQAQALAQWWADRPTAQAARLLGPVLAAADATGGPAWHATAPVYEPGGASDDLLLLDRIGTLRYHRADAHAAAWRAAGLTAEQMQALPATALRDDIERRTNELAAPPYAVLSVDERAELLAALRALPVSTGSAAASPVR
jgi:8-oxo-dGTP pyrophosphatase MutT (NUDIX family)